MAIPAFSLVVASIERIDEIERLFASLATQAFSNFEVIVVDQNADDRLLYPIERYSTILNIQRVRSAKGLSRARNVALSIASGKYIAFPDDDCWYPSDLLARVAEIFERDTETSGITGLAISGDGHFAGSGNWDESPGVVTTRNVWRRGISYTIFLRSSLVNKVGSFDETLGVGSGTQWGAGEETDYLLRCLAAGGKIYYEPLIQVYHPRSSIEFTQADAEKAYRYGLGIGRVLRRHHYPLWFCAYGWLRSAGGAVLAMLRLHVGQARFYHSAFRGKFLGWYRGKSSC